MNDFDDRLDAIVRALDIFEARLTEARPTDLAGFVAGRIGLSRAASDFLANEWQDLRKTIDERANSRGAQEKVHNAFVSLRGEYSAHIARWNSDSLVRDWPTYRRESMRLITKMRELLKLRFSQPTMEAC